MSGYRLSAPAGDAIDRSRTFEFAFNGRAVPAHPGDSVASALLAAGIVHVGRSFKLHRPRGIFSCGPEEPSALLDIGDGARRTPNSRATELPAQPGLRARSVNCWPSLNFDLAAINGRLAALMPAGFYYKTFIWPRWTLFEPAIRRMAGLGVAADRPDPDRYDERSLQVDVLVVGAGASGQRAALAAARAGREVMVLETDSQVPTGGDAAALRRLGVKVALRTTAIGIYDHLMVAAIEVAEDGPSASMVRERLWKIRTRQVILATGAFERPLLFPDNDRPGVMLAGAVARYASRYGVACGRRVALATACDASYRVARQLQSAGIELAAIIDAREAAQIGDVAPPGVPLLPHSVVTGVHGTRAVRAIEVAGQDGRGQRRFDVDLVAVCGGLTPNVGLYSQAGGELTWDEEASMHVPRRPLPGVAVVGRAAGVFDRDRALEHAEAVGRMPPHSAMPAAPVGGAGRTPADHRPSAATLARLRRPGKVFVDLQNDVALGDVAIAARENYRSVEHLKRYTTLGMATDQGKTSNVNGLVQLGLAIGRNAAEVGTTRFRPPYQPVTLGTLAAGRGGARLHPLKPLPAHEWHRMHGALFEEFGGWQRPVAYPRPGEGLEQAIRREAAQVRAGVGLFDASPLGKIEVCGPDAAAFLDLMYVGTMSSLAVGGARYGALLSEHGVIADDGIVARLGRDHFWINTTSGGAERVARGFEEWLQCEYLQHRVMVMPVTEVWGNVTVTGPNAWTLLERCGFDAALAPASMKHMTMRATTLDGQCLRVLRASFSGELGYELNLPRSFAAAMLERLWIAGQTLGVCLYGVEALMTMRIEKGYLHLGADTDGTTLPQDVGLDRGIATKQANFVGRRSLLRPAAIEPDRPQLVGIQPIDRMTPLPVGAQLSPMPPPGTTQGCITSSCFSPTLAQPVALAMLRGGRGRLGERLGAWHLGRRIEVEVVALPFVDREGLRLKG